jgi:hypothetical protein
LIILSELRIKAKQERCRRLAMLDFAVFMLFVWIEDKQSKAPIKLRLWPSQAAVIPQIINSLLLIFLKTRQIGLTWIAAAYVLWCALKYPLFLTIVISLNEDHSTEFLDRVKFILKRLPSWMVPPIKKETTQNIIFDHQGTESSILSMPTIETGAESKTPNLLVIDEAHSIREIANIYNSSYPGIQQAHGQVIVIANSVKTGPGWPWVRDTYMASMRGDNSFTRIFLPWMAHPDRPGSFRELMVKEGMDPDDVKMHYPETEEEAISVLGGSYFGDVLARHTETCHGIKGSIFKNRDGYQFIQDPHGIIELWRYPYNQLEDYDGLGWSNRYAIGSDISEGLGESYSVAHVIDRLKDEVVCRMRSNRVDAYIWGDMLFDLSKYYDNALICPERTGAGQTTIKRLIELKANLYVRMIPDRVTNQMTKVFGWEESNQSKHEMAGDLRQWLRAIKGTLYDALVIDECSTFIKTDSGKLDHESGKLSDCVISAGLAVQADKFQGGKPQKAEVPVSGWLAKLQKEGSSPWARP